MKKRLLALAVAGAALAGTAAVASPATATGSSARTANVTIVHGVPDLLVDVYVVTNLFQRQRFDDVEFKTIASLTVSPGLQYVAILPADDNRLSRPLFQTFQLVGRGQSISVVANLKNTGETAPNEVAFNLFRNDTRPTAGSVEVTVRHLANAPTVDVGIPDAPNVVADNLSNPEQQQKVLPLAGPVTLPVGVFASDASAPATPLFKVGGDAGVALAPDVNAVAYAVGDFYRGSFDVLLQVLPTA